MKQLSKFGVLMFTALLAIGSGYSLCYAQENAAAAGTGKIEASGVESLLFMEIPSVFTASKQAQPLIKAPSSMTVVTADEIKRMGARSLEDVLKRVVGFYPTTSVDWSIIQSRGLGTDMNHLYLFLIDGHSINSINNSGPQNQQVMPVLSDVERIEIVRGPGSTMWGSDAVLGTINFITKDGASIKGLQTSMDYSTVDNDRSLNVLFGNETQSGVNYMGSFTYFQSEGWKGIKDDGVANRLLGIETANGVDMANWNTWKPSWEMYGKAKINGFTLSARMLSFTFLEPYRDRPGAASGRQYVLDTAFLEAAYLKEIDDTMNVETKVFSDFEDKGRDPLFGSDQDMKQREIGWGLDSVLHKTFCDKHHLQFGVRANVINSGPNTLVNMNGDTGALTSSSTTSNMKYDQSGVDKTYGAYIEDQSDITEKLTLIAGARLDHNNWREKGTTFDPRWGVVYALTDKWTLKYLYNSGYYRPSVAQSKRVPSTIGDTIRNADQSLQSFDHDWQILYNDAKTTATVTWFFMSLNNYIAIGPASGTLEGGYMNLGRFNTKGLELDVRRQVMEKLSVYGNYAYALGSVADFADGFEPTLMGTGTGVLAAWMDDNNHVLNYPRHIYNIGFDWKFLKDCNLNVHMRAWADCLMRWGGPAYTAAGRYEANHQPGNQVFDTTILLENLFKKPLSLSLTCRNVFNRRAINPFNVGNYSWYYEEARSFDTHVTYKF